MEGSGVPALGLAPVKTDDLDLLRFEPGDVLWWVDFAKNPKEPAMGALDGRPVWVWQQGSTPARGASSHRPQQRRSHQPDGQAPGSQ